MEVVKDIESRINEGKVEPTIVKEPVRISYRDRFRHPVKIVGVERPDKFKEANT